jgi:dihydroorotate dehydrogenase
MSLAFRLMRPFVFAIDPELAHRLAVRGVAAAGLVPHKVFADPRLAVRVLGLAFPNPVGLAAGFDKNATVIDATLAAGFGYSEVGTLTPRPQAGNPRPRVFRLPSDHAVINRMGFNNEGFDAAERRLKRRRPGGIVGVNIGANRDSADRVADYVGGIVRFAPLADYIAVNISSPNTPGLRDLQERSAVTGLVTAIVEARRGAAKPVPILLKLAPDLDDAALEAIATTAIDNGIEGLIVTNTTIARDGIGDSKVAAETGGLSGRPLFRRSTAILARLRKLAGRKLVLVGVGGIDSAETAWEKMAAGADLIQVYTGMVYEGLGLAAEIAGGLARRLDRERIGSIGEIVGSQTDRWARERA